MKPDFVIVGGSANRNLAIAVAQLLDVEVGRCRVERFPDTEVNIQLDEPVRGRRVFIVQSFCPPRRLAAPPLENQRRIYSRKSSMVATSRKRQAWM